MSRHFSATHIFVDNFENRMICYQKKSPKYNNSNQCVDFHCFANQRKFHWIAATEWVCCVCFVSMANQNNNEKNWKRFIFVRPMLYSNCLYNSAIVINSFLLLPSPISLESIISTTFPYIRSLLWLTNIFPFTWFELISFLTEWDTMLSKTNK